MTAEPTNPGNRRVLVIDDNESIQRDYCRILAPQPTASNALLEAEAALFGEPVASTPSVCFEVTCASQGQEGLLKVREAARAGVPFAMAFVDMRMPPGWDGLETIERIWAEHPDLEVVICTAFSDHSWEDMVRRLGRNDRLLILKKPFDPTEVLQLAATLTCKWELRQQSRQNHLVLEQRVSERTQEIELARQALATANKELFVAWNAAEAASRAKSAFLANISHELRTPMTAILGFSEELLADAVPGAGGGETFEGLATIRRNAQRLIGIVNDLLDTAKLEAGKLAVDRAPARPAEVVSDVVEMLRPAAVAKGLRLDAACVGTVPAVVETDPQRLRQILTNVVHNAIKFTRQGSVEVRVSMAATPAPKLVFEVVDTGIGMTAEAMARLFRPFEQADVTTTREFGGTGLGLAIARQLAIALGGDIEVQSRPESGSTFRISIDPGVTQAAPQDPQSGREAAAAGSPGMVADALRGLRVLVVEDGPDNQRLLGHVLRRAGCTYEVVDNGLRCLERMAASPRDFDVVLMDVQMPVMDGLTATARLRQSGCTVPIVALTANAMMSDRQACLSAGCDHFLTKPIDRRELMRVLGGVRGTTPSAS